MASYLVHPRTRTALSTKNLAAGVAGQLCALNALNLVATTAPTTVLLPPLAGEGECCIVEDLSGSAGTNNITVDGNGDTIDGAATLVLNDNDEIAALVFDEGEWKRVTPMRLFEASSNPVPFSRTTDLAGAIGTSWPLIAPDGSFLQMGTTNPATEGDHRFRNTRTHLAVRNVAGTENLHALTSSGNALYYGTDAAFTAAKQPTESRLWAASRVYIGTTGTTRLRVESDGSGVTLYNDGDPLQFGITNPAATGALRARNLFEACIRNAGNTADILWALLDGSNYMWIGDNAANTKSTDRTHLAANNIVGLRVQGANYVEVQSFEMRMRMPIVGMEGGSSPYGVHGGFAYAFAADANYTVVATQYKYSSWAQFDTGAITADRTVTWPAPTTLDRGYTVFIYNATTFNLTFSTGVGTTRTLASLFARRYHFDSTGVRNAGNLVTP